jgi:hypothetical protein
MAVRFDLELERMKKAIRHEVIQKKSLDIHIDSCHINIRREESFWAGGIFIERTADWPHAMAESFCTFNAHIHGGNLLVVSLTAQHKSLSATHASGTVEFPADPPESSTELVAREVKDFYMMWLKGVTHT